MASLKQIESTANNHQYQANSIFFWHAAIRAPLATIYISDNSFCEYQFLIYFIMYYSTGKELSDAIVYWEAIVHNDVRS